MKQTATEQRLTRIAEPVVQDAGMELVCLQFRRESRGWVLRLYVERPGGEVGLEDCGILSRELSDVLDVEDPIDLPYRLEVSSPGLDRPLTRSEHFQRFLGRRIKLQTVRPIRGRRHFTGMLERAEGDTIGLSGEWGSLELVLDDIEHANLVAQIGKPASSSSRGGA